MSYNFGEIIKKLYSLFQGAKPSRHSRLPPHLLASCDGGFSTWWREMCELQAQFSLARFTREMEGGGRGDLRIDSIKDHRIRLKFNMKMDNDVLLLCYLDKICLTLTGDFWRALASLYSGARL
jgi:hypothetical protein